MSEPKIADVYAKLTHYLGLLDQITPEDAQYRRTGDLNLTVAELRVLLSAARGGAPAPEPPYERCPCCAGSGKVRPATPEDGMVDV